jgi:chromate transporter
MDSQDRISLRNIFFVFLKIGTFAFGGVYSMLTFFERELVERHKWITHDEFIESVALGQMTPGPPIINTGICIGYKLRKLKGAVVSILGQSFTGTLLAIILAMFYIKTRDNVLLRSMLKGVAAAVVGLLLSIIYKMARGIVKDSTAVIFAIGSFIALALFKQNPILIICMAGALGFLVFRKKSP